MQGSIFGQEDELGLVIRDDQADGRAQMLKQVTDITLARDSCQQAVEHGQPLTGEPRGTETDRHLRLRLRDVRAVHRNVRKS